MDKKTDIQRREFLKLLTEGVRYVAFSPVVPKLQEIANPNIQIPIEPDFTNHVLEPGMVTKNTALVLGETSLESLKGYYGINSSTLDYTVLNKPESEIDEKDKGHRQENRGIGSDPDRAMLARIIVSKLKQDGVNMVLTDYLQNSIRFDLLLDSAIENTKIEMGTFLAEFASVAIIDFFAANKLELTEKSLVTLLGLTEAPIIATNIDEKTDFKTTKLLNSLAGEVNERTINNRNLNMTQNTRIVQKVLSQNSILAQSVGFDEIGSKSILFYAGGAHGDVKRLFKETDQEIGAAIKKSVNQDIELGITLMRGSEKYKYTERLKVEAEVDGKIEKVTKKEVKEIKTRDELIELWLSLLECYSFPVASFFTSEEHQNFDNYNVPASARETLWRGLINQYSNSDPERQKHLSELISILARNDVNYFNDENRKLPPIDAMFTRMDNARLWGKTEEVNLNFLCPALGEDGSKFTLVFFEGTPYVIKS